MHVVKQERLLRTWQSYFGRTCARTTSHIISHVWAEDTTLAFHSIPLQHRRAGRGTGTSAPAMSRICVPFFYPEACPLQMSVVRVNVGSGKWVAAAEMSHAVICSS